MSGRGSSDNCYPFGDNGAVRGQVEVDFGLFSFFERTPITIVALFSSWGAEYRLAVNFNCWEWEKVKDPVMVLYSGANASASSKFSKNG